MKKLALATAAALALTIAAPAVGGLATPAEAQTVVKKKVVIKRGHHDRGRHLGWRHHGGKKVVVIKRGGHHGGKTVIKKKITHG